jgi:protein O-mannosyl-transferase
MLLYAGCICGSFIYDDISHIQENPALTSWRGTLHYFQIGDTFANDLLPGGGSSYRPLLWLSLALDRHLWGLHPCGFHITNLLLHWISGSLYFFLLRRMRAPTLLAATVCLLWLSLPVNSEAVAWISGRTYPLMAVFLASSLLAANSYLTKGSTATLFLYAVGLLAALLSNEEGILVLPLTIVLTYFREKAPQRRWLTLGIAGVVPTAIYFVLRRFAEAHPPSGPASFLMLGTAFFKYLMWILFPAHMSVERSTDTPANSLSVASVAASVGIFCLLILLYWLRKKNALTALGLTWMVVALLPFCGIVPLYQGMAERYVYLASFGLALAIIAAAWQSSTPKRLVVFSLIILWGFWGAKRLELRALDWKDPISLYQSSLETTPRSTKLNYNLGTAFEAAGNFYQARESYQKALAINPKYVSAMIGLGNVDQRTGNMAKAEQEYRQAAATNPAGGNPYCYLGALLFREGETDRAIQELSKALAINPSNPTAYLDLGVIYQKTGDSKRAAQMYVKVLTLQPGQPDALTNLQTLRSAE